MGSVFLGDQIVSEVRIGDLTLIAKGSPDIEPSKTVSVYLPKERLVVFAERELGNSQS